MSQTAPRPAPIDVGIQSYSGSSERETLSAHCLDSTVDKQGRLGQASAWDRSLHYYDPHNSERTAQYLLAVDALNFCFWDDAEFEYEHLAGGLKQSLQRDPQILDAGWM